MKIMNFRRFDQKYADRGKTGLSKGGQLEEEIWNTYHPDPARLQRTAASIRLALQEPQDVQEASEQRGYSAEFSDELVEADEGRVLSVLHFRRERSARLAKAKKARVLRTNGRLACEVCYFDFREAYGERGDGFIECHHVKPLEDLASAAKTHIDDLALLCANCHRMIHARRPWLSLDALRSIRQPRA